MIGALVVTLALGATNKNNYHIVNNNPHETSTANPKQHHHQQQQQPNHQTYEFHVAPMQGYTNAPLRHLFRLLSPNAILWTEMEKVCDLQHAIKNQDETALEKRFGSLATDNNNNNNLVLQVGGNHVEDMQTCIKALTCRGYNNFREINLNCGCPSIETGGGNFGASLMKDARLTRQLVQAISESCAPTTAVSLKCRTAVFDTVEQMLTALASPNNHHYKEQTFETLCEYIDQARRGGISHVILHARPAILAGLSPSKNRIVPLLDYDMVDRVAAEFSDLRVTLNGGIASMKDLETLIGKTQQQHAERSSGSRGGIVGSHMAGRWMLQHPLALAAVQGKFLTPIHQSKKNHEGSLFHDFGYDVSFLSSVLDQYMFFVQDSLSRRIHCLSELCLPLYLIIEELRMTFDDVSDDNTNGKESDNRMSVEADLFLVLHDVMGRLSTLNPGGGARSKARAFGNEDVNWKRLSKHLQDMVGKKVYNKWKRNRNEL